MHLLAEHVGQDPFSRIVRILRPEIGLEPFRPNNHQNDYDIIQGMSAEYLRAKEDAWNKLASDTASNLGRIQRNGLKGEFSFRDHWKRTKQDKSTHPHIPVMNQFSRMFLNFHVRTWVDYSYRNGELSADIYQNLGDERAKLVGHHDTVDVADIPFDKFSEADILNAAKTIESQL